MPTDAYRDALAHNATWADDVCKSDPELFPRLAQGQHPQILWLGCADSRCPETTLLGLKPGEVFVHRNIANLVHPTDLNIACVIEYAVVHLKVAHIVLCGHTMCGGVAGALGSDSLGILDAWLVPLKQLKAQHAKELDALADDKARARQLVEISVNHGVSTLKQMANVQKAVEERGLQIHGIVYDIATGKIKEVVAPTVQ